MKTLVISPHPDDETLGVGGTILKRLKKGHKVALLLITELKNHNNSKKQKEEQISKVFKAFKLSKTYRLNIEASKVDQVPLENLFLTLFKNLGLMKYLFHILQTAIVITKWFIKQCLQV